MNTELKKNNDRTIASMKKMNDHIWQYLMLKDLSSGKKIPLNDSDSMNIRFHMTKIIHE